MDDDFITEAEALGYIYAGLEREPWEDFEPYSDAEKREYIRERGIFSPIHKGKFVIVQDTRHNRQIVKRLYLVDRSITKMFWWSHAACFAMKFNSRSVAENIASRYKHNNVRVLEIK